jgi:hypothetical protein
MGVAAVGTVQPNLRIREAVKQLVQRVADADDANRGWLGKQEKLTRLRFGQRRPRIIPWKGASNLTIPLIDKTIRRWRPPITSLILDAEPVAIFTPQEVSDFDPAHTVQPFFTWMFREQMRTTREIVHLVDTLAFRGHTYSREGWHYRTQRKSRIVSKEHLFPEGMEAALAQSGGVSPIEVIMQRIAQDYDVPMTERGHAALQQAAMQIAKGADFGRLVTQELVDNRPSWHNVDPIHVITPVDQAPQESDFFCIIHRMGFQKINQMARDGTFHPGPAQELIKALRENKVTDPETSPADDIRETIRRVRDRQAAIESDTGKNTMLGETSVWELFAHLDLDGDGVEERVVIWYAPALKLILQLFEYPLPFDRWPITPYEFNVDSDRIIDNRGIPEMVLSFQKITSAMYNARIDASTLLLSPAFTQNVASGNYGQSVNYRPGAIFPVTHPQDLQPIVHDLRILAALLQEQQVGQAVAEDYVGTFDATIGRLQDQNAPERRTATEVSAIQNVASSVFGLDAKLFQEQMSESMTKIWNLYEDFGPPDLFFRVQGEQKPRLAKKSEIVRNYDIRAAGTPANTQKQVILSAYREVLPLAFQDRSGVVNLPALLEAYLKVIDPIVAKQAVRPLEQSNQVAAIQQAADIAAPDSQFGGL